MGISSAQAAVPASERQALINLYNATGGTSWTQKTGWNGAAGTECSWYGVTCDKEQNHVTGVDLGFHNTMVGSLPSFVDLPALQTFSAADNQLSGPIPPLSGLTGLRSFNVAGNQLSGGIPALGGLTALEYFNVGGNHLSGPIPALSGLTKLREFWVQQNALTGPLPALDGLVNLEVFNAFTNQLTGTIPALASHTALQAFDVMENRLSGSIPPLDGLANLRSFSVGSNQLTGPIPSLEGLTALTSFYAWFNQLTGSIPRLSGLTALESIRVGFNLLTGPPPLPPTSLLANRSDICNNLLVASTDSAVNAAWVPVQDDYWAGPDRNWLKCQQGAHALSVILTGTGYGQVSSTPTGITCYRPQPGLADPDCGEEFDAGTVVELRLAQPPGHAFGGWTGACSGTGSCVVLMDQDRYVGARFSPPRDMLSSLAIRGSATVQANGRTTLSAAVVLTDGNSVGVAPLWSSSNTVVATISAAGVVSAGSVAADTPVTLTATYAESGVTLRSSHVITVTNTPAALASVSVIGQNRIPSGGQVLLAAAGNYADGSTRDVSPVAWKVTPSALGSVDSRGMFTAATVSVDTPATITATYAEGGVSASGGFNVTITVKPPVLSDLQIAGARGTLGSGRSMNLSANGVYEDGSSKPVGATWSSSAPGLAAITSSGVLTAGSVTVSTPVKISASYTEGNVTKTAAFQILIQPAVSAVPFAVEVLASGSLAAYSLSIWFNSQPDATTQRGVFAEIQSYKLFVAAQVPAGSLVSTPTWFVLNRSADWGQLSLPLAEYLSNITLGSWTLIQLFATLDASLISGTQVYVGYGTSYEEMLEKGRYSLVYQVP